MTAVLALLGKAGVHGYGIMVLILGDAEKRG